MTKIKLTYFDIEGAAEPVRLALALAGKEYEDDRVKFPDWKDLKPKTPYGQLPVMTIDDDPKYKTPKPQNPKTPKPRFNDKKLSNLTDYTMLQRIPENRRVLYENNAK